MSNLFSGISGRFRGGAAKNDKNAVNLKTPTTGPSSSQNSSPTTPELRTSQSSSSLAPRVPPLSASPSLTHSISMDDQNGNAQDASNADPLAAYNLPRPKPLWLDDTYSKHIVKGNFMTLSVKPRTVDPGEWIAHQVVEHYRNLWNFVRIIHDQEEDGTSVCNSRTCPRMSAGANHSFTWLNFRREPVEVPASEYISLMQRWISGKIANESIFPTDSNGVSYAVNAGPPVTAGTPTAGTPGTNPAGPAWPTTPNASLLEVSGPGDWVGKNSGFPQDFVEVCQTIFRQMFRVYAHLYWAHYIDPFYHLNLDKHINSCFSHFILTATTLDMLKPHELEPMQPLIDLWAANGTFPPESKAYECANLKAGEKLIALSSKA